MKWRYLLAVMLLCNTGRLWAAVDIADTAGANIPSVSSQVTVQAASVGANIQGSSSADTAVQLQKAQEELKEKDALIERLSNHLGSALARLNSTSSPLSNSSTSALNEEREELEKQNNLLRVKQAALQAQIEDLSKKSQLLDLENRQLYEALNGRPSVDRYAQIHAAQNDTNEAQETVVFGR